MIHHRCTCLCIIRQHNIFVNHLEGLSVVQPQPGVCFVKKSEVFHKFDAPTIFSSHYPFNIIYFLNILSAKSRLALRIFPPGSPQAGS